MNWLKSILHDSGGLTYHWRSLRFRGHLWEAHLKSTQAFLLEWNPDSKVLYLIGPSGGYSLPRPWLKKFDRIIAIEPDPVARLIFTLRTGIWPSWIKTPFSFPSPDAVNSTFEAGSAILFCNLLGQMDFDQDSGMNAQEALLRLSEHHPLASYHDVLSGDGFRFEYGLSSPEIAAFRSKIDPEDLDPYISPQEGVTELDLHLHPAAYLFQDEPPFTYQYWEWRLTEKQTHIIEGIFSKS